MLQKYIDVNLVTGLEHCKVCYKTYEGKHRSVRKRQLFDHIERVHLKLRSYVCDYCGHTFNSKAQKASHISLKHRLEHKTARIQSKPTTPVKMFNSEPVKIEAEVEPLKLPLPLRIEAEIQPINRAETADSEPSDQEFE